MVLLFSCTKINMELFVVSLVVVSSTLGVEGAAVTSFDAWVDQCEAPARPTPRRSAKNRRGKTVVLTLSPYE